MVVALAVASTGCGASGTAPATAANAAAADAQGADEQDESRLPRGLEELNLSASQRRKILALRDKLELRLAPMEDAGREYALAVAQAVERCDGNHIGLEDAASWAVTVGEQVRGAVLDAIDELHAILTPAQRKALSQRLRDAEERNQRERDDDEGVRKVGEAVDLSLGQMLQLVVRAQALRNVLEERLGPWRGKLESALIAFGEDDFSIRNHAIAEVPAVLIATRFARDALRTLLPVLEQQQCKVLGKHIKEAIEEAAAKAERDAHQR